MIRLQLFTYQCGLLERYLPVLELFNVPGLGPWPNIFTDMYSWAYHPYNNKYKRWILLKLNLLYIVNPQIHKGTP